MGDSGDARAVDSLPRLRGRVGEGADHEESSELTPSRRFAATSPASGGGAVARSERQPYVCSIKSRRAPASFLCMCTMNAMPNSGVAKLRIGIDTKAAMSAPASTTVP